MARKKVVRRLPQLPKIPALKPNEHKAERLLEIMRHVAVAAQEERPRTFYSMREVASKFRVPISTVAHTYQRLEQEGLLTRIRGSKTTLRGLKYDRKLSVRAFVGLPTTISKYVTVQDYRMFLMCVRRQLRVNGFAAAMLDIECHEADDFAERVRKYEIDTIIWFQPGRLAKQAVLRLNDLGLRIVGVSHGGRPSLPCHYQVRRETAIRNILRSWRAEAGLKSVIVVSGQARDTLVDQVRFEEILSEEEFKSEFQSASSESISKVLKSLSQKDNVGIVFLSSAAPMFAFRSPETMTAILQKRRVALIEGPVNMPFARIPDVNVDLVLVDWQSIAEKIVNDLIAQEGRDGEHRVVFEAEAKLQVPLSTYAQVI